MEKTFEQKTCDTLLRLKEQVIVNKNKQIEALDFNFKLEKEKGDMQRNTIVILSDLVKDSERQNKKLKRQKGFLKFGCVALGAASLVETILILTK